jgi:hypothetical protein
MVSTFEDVTSFRFHQATTFWRYFFFFLKVVFFSAALLSVEFVVVGFVLVELQDN